MKEHWSSPTEVPHPPAWVALVVAIFLLVLALAPALAVVP